MSNTRINPTCNGLPHLGHAYLALVNQHEAASTGGHMALIFDDTQPCWIESVGREQMQRYAQEWIDDLAWLGITFRQDEIVYQSQCRPWLAHEMARLCIDIPESREYPYAPIVVGESALPYPWDDFLTIEKVLIDHAADVNYVIRGDDLRDEYALYQNFWHRYVTRKGGAEPPQHIYLKRLLRHGDELDTVSKTNGENKIRKYREMGLRPQDVDEILRLSCLVDPQGDWSWRNVKAQPRLIT